MNILPSLIHDSSARSGEWSTFLVFRPLGFEQSCCQDEPIYKMVVL